MNITEFAEQIVFGTTLEEKLAAPGRLSPDTKTSPRKTFEKIAAPGRPYGLEMQPPGNSNLTRPRDENLENEAERGKLLHFLANHELLATELMALVLLKFPDAPHAFRRGVLVTLREEQAHTQMYIDRMRDCGVEFGNYPVSGQFWQIVEPMQSPMDFVSRLSLTFEQANLDYSQHFAKVFSRIGDEATASVLQQIYEDEIGHVQHGLHWFRQWKDPSKSDWEAYEASLDFPMSPQRARAPKIDFNRAGRERAGLDRSYIEAVEVFQLSRGRATTVRWFDAGAELELSGSRNSKTKFLVQQLNQDLQLVMLPLSKPDDILLVDHLPSKQLRKQLIDAGFALPEFSPKTDLTPLTDRKLHNCDPWAWTPSSHSIAEDLKPRLKHASHSWRNSNADLFRKSWSNSLLAESLTSTDRDDSLRDLFCEESVVGKIVTTNEQFEFARNHFAELGYQNVLFKPDLSASGRGQRRFQTAAKLSAHDIDWLQSAFGQESNFAAIVEPELDRVFDFSMLWNVAQNGPAASYQGWSHQLIGDGRRYLGSQLDKSLAGCDAEIKRFFLEQKCERVNRTADWVGRLLATELTKYGVAGPFGVDAFVYRDNGGLLKIKPIVELNPRHTMGHVSVALAKRIANGVEAQFRILTIPQCQSLLQHSGDVRVSSSHQKQWTSGIVLLGEINTQTKMVPAVLVGFDICRLAKSLAG